MHSEAASRPFSFRKTGRIARYLFLALVILPLVSQAQSIVDTYPQVRQFFPQADGFGALEGKPPAAAIHQGKRLLGYVFLSKDVVRIPAYSGEPINVLIAIDLQGRINGIQIVQHAEPILLAGVSEAQLRRYIQQYQGKRVTDRLRVGAADSAGNVAIDTIAGATITVMVANATIVKSAREILAARSAAPSTTNQKHKPRVNMQDERNTGAVTTKPVTSETQAGDELSGEPIWIDVWRQRSFVIGVLLAGLLWLTLIVIFQDSLARRPVLLSRMRTLYLLYTLFFIGWYGLAQLSVLNVLIFIKALVHDFSWNSFLIDPMIFILWTFVAMTLLLLGRGIYCGWLCPFGALQELVNKLARKFSLRQIEFPELLHERLWALKYIILLVLFGLSLQSIEQAEALAEVEPFKTAITMHFQREWPFVVYAIALVAMSAWNHKFYCRYLCPLGAALTLPGKYRIFQWLRRRKECGVSCQLCAEACGVRAIRPDGQINADECHYCLDCQVIYWDKNTCPPLLQSQQRRSH